MSDRSDDEEKHCTFKGRDRVNEVSVIQHVKLKEVENIQANTGGRDGMRYLYDDVIRVNNRYDKLSDEADECNNTDEYNNTDECNLTATIINAAGTYRVARETPNVISLREKKKPVIFLKKEDKIWDALVDTGSESCLINFKHVKFLKAKEIKKSNICVKGVNKQSSVIGKCELKINLPNKKSIITNALIIKDGVFNYDLILGTDVLQNAVIDMKKGKICIQGNTIDFVNKVTRLNKSKLNVNDCCQIINETECVLSDIVFKDCKKMRKVKKLKSNTCNSRDLSTPSMPYECEVNNLAATNKVFAHTSRRQQSMRRRSSLLNVHTCEITIPANSLTTVNAFVRSKETGQYIVKKNILSNGLLIAESIIKMGNSREVPILVLNASDEDIIVKENEMLTKLERCEVSEVVKESFIMDLDDALRQSSVKTNEAAEVNCGETNKMSSCDKAVNRFNCKQQSADRRSLTTADVECSIEDCKEQCTELLNEFRDVITLSNESIGVTNICEHRIKLQDNAPVINQVPYRIAHKYRQELDKVTNKMLDDDIIKPSLSNFNFPVIIVEKKTGEIRPVIDYRALNKIVQIESYPIPRIDEILYTLNNNTIYSNLDLRSAFHQVKLSEDSKQYTAFSVNFKKFNFKRLPFGYANSTAVFQNVMCSALSEILGTVCFVFLDDILVFSETKEQHFADLRAVLMKLRAGNLAVKLEKCKFFHEKIEYLGHSISAEGISCVQNKKLRNMPVPTNVKELQRFLGLANYFRKFIPVFSRVANPLYNLLKKDQEYIWTEECNESFIKLKDSLISSKVLAHPDFNKTFYLFTDASDKGIGSCLMQADKNANLRPIAYFSKSLNSTQKRYSVTKKEMLAIHVSLKEFKFLIFGYDLVILTDHLPLKGFFNKKLPLDSALARWSIDASTFRPEIRYYPGKNNVVADTLSRMINESELLSINDTDNEHTEVECGVVTTRATAKKQIADSSANGVLQGCKSKQQRSNTQNNNGVLSDYIPAHADISWSEKELHEAQLIDPFCCEIRSMLSNEDICNISDLHKYLLIDDILYKQRSIDGFSNSTVLTIVIPTSLMDKAIKSVHFENHSDRVHTMFSFKLKYYHVHERAMIRAFTENCELCKLLKGRSPVPIKIRNAPVPSRPFETVSIDHVGPFVKTDNGNKYILVIMDLFSRFSLLYAVPSKDTNIVVDCLSQVFHTYGFPDTLLSDNAPEFKSSAVKLFAESHSIAKKEILPYSAWANGILERSNARITKLLKLHVNCCSHGQWDLFIDIVQNSINNQVIVTLRETPSFALLGYDTSPAFSRKNLDTLYNYDSPASAVQYRLKQNLLIQQQIKANITNCNEQRNLQRNLNRKDKILNVNDRVLIKNHTKQHKLELSWLGPGKIVSVNGNRAIIDIQHKQIRANVNHILPLKCID